MKGWQLLRQSWGSMNGVGDMVFSGKKKSCECFRLQNKKRNPLPNPRSFLGVGVDGRPNLATVFDNCSGERVAQHGQQAKESLPALDVEPLKTKKAKDHPTTLPQVLLQPLSREIWCPYWRMRAARERKEHRSPQRKEPKNQRTAGEVRFEGFGPLSGQNRAWQDFKIGHFVKLTVTELRKNKQRKRAQTSREHAQTSRERAQTKLKHSPCLCPTSWQRAQTSHRFHPWQ